MGTGTPSRFETSLDCFAFTMLLFLKQNLEL